MISSHKVLKFIYHSLGIGPTIDAYNVTLAIVPYEKRTCIHPMQFTIVNMCYYEVAELFSAWFATEFEVIHHILSMDIV